MSVAVQYGNPISVPGMAIYGAAGVVCVMAIRDTNLKLLPPIVGIIALAWVLTLAHQVIGKVSVRDVFILQEMEREHVDEARRMTGLLVVMFWMAVVSVVFWRQRIAEK
ncbi:MAG: transmembrane 220 family protein [Blastocatellia bacterium]